MVQSINFEKMGKISNVRCYRNKLMICSAQGTIGLYDLKSIVETGDTALKQSELRFYNNIVTECDSFDINDRYMMFGSS